MAWFMLASIISEAINRLFNGANYAVFIGTFSWMFAGARIWMSMPCSRDRYTMREDSFSAQIGQACS
jgi:hypothetical protein